jgi:hypothetical protein
LIVPWSSAVIVPVAQKRRSENRGELTGGPFTASLIASDTSIEAALEPVRQMLHEDAFVLRSR